MFLTRLEDRRVLSVAAGLDGAGQLSIGVSGNDTATLINDGSEIAVIDDQGNPVDVTDSSGQLIDPLGVDDVKSIQVVGSDDGQSQAVAFAGNAFTLTAGLNVDSNMESATFDAPIVGATTASVTVDASHLTLSADVATAGQDIRIAGELTVTTFVELDPGSATTDLSAATGQFDVYDIGAVGHDVVLSPAGSSPSTIYVDDGWNNLGFGEDPDGAGPARWYRIDSFSTIQEGVEAASIGGTVNVFDGTYSGNVDTSIASVTLAAGASPGQVVVHGDMTLDHDDTLAVDLDGTASGSEYDQWVVNGDVALGGAQLDVSLGLTPVPGDAFTIIDNGPGGVVDGQFDNLADRATLLVDRVPLQIDYRVDAGGHVVLSYDVIAVLNADDLGVGVDNAIEVRLDAGDNIEVEIDGIVVLNTPVRNAASLTINGQTGDDRLTVDFSRGDPIPGGGLVFHGGFQATPQGDELFVTGGSGFGSIAYNATGAGAGDLNLDGSLVVFTGLEPIDVAPVAGTVTINIDPDGNVSGTINSEVTNDATVGKSRISFDNGLESMTFSNPTVALVINGDIDSDDVTKFSSLDPGFQASITVDGRGGNDQIELNTDLTLGSAASTGNLNITAETIKVTGGVNTTAGTIGNVTLTPSVLLDIAPGADMILDGTFLQNGTGSVQTAGDITTTGDNITFSTDVTLTDGHAVTLSTGVAPSAGTIAFNGTLNGTTDFAEDLTLTAGAGNIDFGGSVGGTRDLGAVLITSAVDVTAAAAFRANTFTQSDGTGDTQFDGPVTLEGPGGLAVTTNTVTVNATIDTLSAGNGGTVTILADGNVTMSADGAISTDDADVKIAAGNAPASGGSLTMSDGAVINAGGGLIHLTADGDITLGGLTTANTTQAAVELSSNSGAVVDGGDLDIDVVAPDGGLVIDAAKGVGDTSAAGAADSAIETTVAALHIDSGSSGDIAIDEADQVSVQRLFNATTSDGDASTGSVTLTSGGSMTIEGDGVSAIDGNITLDTTSSATSDLVVDAPIRNQAGEGGILLKAGRDLVIHNTAAEPDVSIDGQSARIVGIAGNDVDVDPEAVIKTGTGFIQSIPTETGEIDPIVILVPVDQGGSNLDSLGRAIIEVTVTAPAGANFEIVIDWTDETIRYTRPQGSPNETFLSDQTYQFRHTYTAPPDPSNPSEPIPVQVTVAFDGRAPTSMQDPASDNGIAFFRNGSEFIDTTVSDQLTVPGDGVFSFIIIVKSEIEPVELRSVSGDVPVTNQAGSVSLQNERLETQTTELESAVRNPARLLLRRVSSGGKEGDDVELPIALLEEGMLEALSRLPNGKYRLYYQEPNSERIRMVREVHVHRGRVVPPDFREDVGERQPGESRVSDSVEDPPLEEIDQQQPGAGEEDGPQAPPPAADESASGAEAAETTGVQAATGSVVVAMGGTILTGRERWSEQVDRAYAAGRKSMTRAARLCRRLLRERSQA